VVDKHDQLNIERVFPRGGKSSYPAWRLVEFSFRKPPASSPHNVKCAFRALLGFGLEMSLFVGQQTSPSGVQFDGDPALTIPTAGEFGPAQIAEIRSKVDDALVEGMKQITATR
jgi:hypothetical protein